MAENNTFDFGQDLSTSQLDDRTSPLESTVPMDPPKKKAGYSFSNDFTSAIEQNNRDTYYTPPQSSFGKFTGPVGPSSVSYAPEQLTDQYMYQEGFDARHFNPYDTTNYQRFADKETWGSALGKGWDSFSYKFGNTFTDYWKGYGRMAEALFTLDWDKMRPDEETMMNQYYQDQIDMKKNFVFEQPGDEDSIFGKRTMSEFIGNAGFALGTFAGLGLEIAADIAITALTGGAGAETFALTAANQAARTAARQAAKEGIFGSAKVFGREVVEGFAKLGTKSVDDLAHINKIREAETIANAGASPLRQAMSQTFEAYNHSWLKAVKSKSFAEFGENMLKGTPLLGTGIKYGERVAAAAKGGATAGQLTGLTLQGLRRVGQELNMAATEASFEGVTSYGDTLDKMVQQHKTDNNGAPPTAQEFEQMRSLAMKASASNYNTNMSILLATNQLQFGTLFNKFLPANMIANEMADQALRVEAKVAGKMLRQQYVKGLAGTYGVLGQVAKDFGKKEALYQFGKAMAKDALAFEVTEGLQENLQETTASGWRDYYAGQMNGAKYSMGEAFGKGVQEQFSKQGLKTFLMGAFTGSIIRLPTALASRSLDAANRKVMENQYKSNPEENPITRAQKQFQEDIKVQNDLFKQAHEGKFSQRMFNFNAQMNSAQHTANASAAGSKYDFENGKDNALLAAVSSAKRTNSIDMLQKAVSEMGIDMTAEDFEKSFGYKLSETNYDTPKQFSEQVGRDIKKYSDVIDNIRNHVKNKLANPFAYSPESRGRAITAMTRNAQEDAIQFIALNAVKGDMTAKRARELSSEILAIPGMANSADYAIRTLTSASAVDTDYGFLESEVASLENSIAGEGIDAKTKKELEQQLHDKKYEILLLNQWRQFWGQRKDILGNDEDGNAITEDKSTIFVGRKTLAKKEVVGENGEMVETDETELVYSIDHKDVLETFRKLMNLRNKQAGSTSELSEQTIQDSFEKIYDYMTLNQDVIDYMRSTDQLLNPENYQRLVARILDGKMKTNLVIYYDQLTSKAKDHLNDIFKGVEKKYDIVLNDIEKLSYTMQYITEITQTESYKNIMTLIADVNVGIEQAKYSQTLMTEADADSQKIINNIISQITGEPVAEEGITAEETPITEESVVQPGTEAFENAPVNAGDQDDVETLPLVEDVNALQENEEVIPVDSEVETLTPPPAPVATQTTEVQNEDVNSTGQLDATDMLSQQLAESGDPFTVAGDETEGYDVVDRNNNPVTNDKIDSEEKAQELSDSLNNTRTNLDFANELLFEGLKNDEDRNQKTIKFIDRAVKSLERYNQRTESEVESLQEYYKISEGKKAINRLVKNIITGKPMEAEAERPAIVEPTSASQLQLFETTATPSNSASLTLESLQALHSKIQGAISTTNMQQISEKNSKFVEEGIVTEESILDELRKITECFS